MECGQLPLLLLLLLLRIYSGHTQDSYKPVLTVSPDRPVIMSGETVILRCDIQWINVTYTWACDSRDVYTSQNNEYIIRHVKVSHSCTYRCFGSMKQWPRFSYWSNPVPLRITESPKSLVSVKPRLQITGGQTVTRSSDESNSEVSLSPLKLVSFLLSASVYVLVSIILGFKYYRAHRV